MTLERRYVAIGVDAGGTSTIASISIDGSIMAEHRAGSANSTMGHDEAARAIVEAISAVAKKADIDIAVPAFAQALGISVGAAGAGDEGVRERIVDIVSARFPTAVIQVVSDAEIALRAAVPQGDGIVLIAGTGSIAYAEIDGQRHRAGGYGYIFGDEGSGFAIGSAAVRHMLHAVDGRVARDQFGEDVARAVTGSANGEDAFAMMRATVRRIYSEKNPVPNIAALAPLVVTAADRGDRSAQRIIQKAALDLSGLVKSLVQLHMREREFPVVFAGGLLQRNSLLTFLLEGRLSNEFPLLQIIKNGPQAHLGALSAAERLVRATC